MLSLILSLGTTESKLHSPAVLPLGKKSRVSIEQETWWAPQPTWTFGVEGKVLPLYVPFCLRIIE
jgi:hypothetical protein